MEIDVRTARSALRWRSFLPLSRRLGRGREWDHTGYTFVKRESAKGVRWEFLHREANGLSPVVAQASLTPSPLSSGLSLATERSHRFWPRVRSGEATLR
jgi:hypothetical protein